MSLEVPARLAPDSKGLPASAMANAKHYRSLSELQEVVLLPPEMELACRREVARWKPGRWARAVERALDRATSSQWP